jgi:hypothetical protein
MQSDWLRAKLSTNALIGRERNSPLLLQLQQQVQTGSDTMNFKITG